jgi:hypothetical protein
VDNSERAIVIDRMLERLAETRTRQTALLSDAREFSGMIGQIRETFGSPCFYSGPKHERPEHADKPVANYTGFCSHDVVLPTVLGIRRVNRELRQITEQLRALGVNVEELTVPVGQASRPFSSERPDS